MIDRKWQVSGFDLYLPMCVAMQANIKLIFAAALWLNISYMIANVDLRFLEHPICTCVLITAID
jgi:hypothetical protein